MLKPLPQRLLASIVVRIVLVALGYYLSGRLGLLLAIPPGYATAVWPASGIALAAVLLMGRRAALGVLVGSFAINILIGLDSSGTWPFLRSLLLPTAIAVGAALQALIGAALIERWVGYRNILIQELQVVWMLALGGPLACLCNASIGVGSLYLKGLIPPANLLFNWWTWWVGDSIGVLIFTPLVLLWSIRPFAHWQRRQLTATVPLVMLFAAVVWLFVFISGQEQQRLQASFNSLCHDYVLRFQRDLKDDYQALNALTGFVQGQQEIDRHNFERFARSQLGLLVGVKSLSWISVVPDAQRAAFEQKIRAQELPDFSIRERGADGVLRPASQRPRYAPVTYIVPSEGNEKARGYDDESEPIRLEALARAQQRGFPSASRAITLVQDNAEYRGLLIVLALDDAQGNTRGYAIAALRNDAVINASLGGLREHGVGIAVFEADASGQDQLIYGEQHAPERGGLALSLPIDVAGRSWQLRFSLPAAYLYAHRSWAVWTLLAGGMLFTALLGMFLLVMIGRSERVEQLVVERTVALARANSLLAQAVERSQKLEGEARHQSTQLVDSNRELEQFAYVASHDLQAPLRNISSFARILEKRYLDRLSSEANEFLTFIRESVDELQQLIDDLLQLSRVNPAQTEMAPLPLGEAVRRATAQLGSTLTDSKAELIVEPLPPVQGDLRLLTQLFQNLIANAVKFQPPGRTPQVHIRSQRTGNGDWQCEVADNGIGIAANNVDKLFQIFRRLNPADQYPGTGIGLALCRKIVGLHGGRIWVESTPGKGSRFLFTLPAA